MTTRNVFRLTLSLLILLAYSAGAFLPRSAASDRIADTLDPGLYSEDWRLTGPPGGDVRALVVDPKDPSHFYFGTLDGQIYTSTDGARTWRLLYNFNIP